MRCRACRHDNREKAVFCGGCGRPLDSSCASCGRRNPPGSAYCDGCGERLPVAGADPVEARGQESAGGDRRQLTVMFCDLVGSTSLSHQLDPEDLRELIRAYQGLCAERIEALGGRVAQYLGDGLLVYFGHPQAHEEDAIRAVAASLGILEELPSLNERLARSIRILRDRPLQIRIALHTGPVLVAEVGAGEKREELALGETANVAARLQSVAQPDTVVLSDATRHLIEGAFVLEELGAHSLKGIAESVGVWRAVRASGVHSRIEAEGAAQLVPFVGREPEIDRMLALWERARGGEGQILVVRGEPGIGKSRLMAVFRERLADQRHGWIECHGSPFHTNSVLYPVLASFKEGLRFSPEDSPRAKVEKLERALRPSGFPVEEVMPLFAHLLTLPLPARSPATDLSPEALRARTFECLVAWLSAVAKRRSTVALVEDLQWLDATSLELLGLLLERARGLPLLVLLTARPEFKSPWGEGAAIAELELSPLDRHQTTRLIHAVAGPRPVPTPLVEDIVARSDGIPLFAEELTRTILLSPARQVASSKRETTIPSTLQDSLMARLDRLSAPARELAQIASVLGREFSNEVLLAVHPLDALELEQRLMELGDAGLVHRSGASPRTRHLFRHALIREAAYQSLLKGRRRAIHRRVAEAWLRHFPERSESEPETVARHFEKSDMPAEAVSYYERAAERAMAASAHTEAIAHLSRAIELIRQTPAGLERTQRELTLQVALGAPLLAAKGYGAEEVERSHRRAQQLCEEVGEGPALYQALSGLFLFHLARAELDVARDLAARLLALGERAGDHFVRKWGHFFSSAWHYYVGDFQKALDHAESAIALHDPMPAPDWCVHEHDPEISARVYAAMSLSNLGRPDGAGARMEEALVLGRQSDSPWNRAFSFGFAAMFHHMRREPELALRHADEAIAIAKEHGFPFWLGMGTALRGWARASTGAGREGLDEVLQGVGLGASSGTRIGGSRMLGVVGETYRAAGMTEQAVGAFRGALAMSKQTGTTFWDAELERLLGETLLDQDPAAAKEAEHRLEHAMAVAHRQQARLLELRAASSIVRLRRGRDRSPQTVERLAELYRRFTEGLDTPDLREARTLLAECGGATTPTARSG